MLTKILIGMAALIVVLAIVIAMQPAHFTVTRSATMSAPPEAAFALVNDFRNWQGWSPWAKLDPAVKETYEGSAAGDGAVFRWDGNKDVGQGNMTITGSRPAESIRIRLEFIKPFAAVNDVEFTFKSAGADQTTVTWTMSGKNNFVGKAVGLIMNCDKFVGSQFEKGLAAMKGIVETTTPKTTAVPAAAQKG